MTKMRSKAKWLIPVMGLALLLLAEGTLRVRQSFSSGTLGYICEYVTHEPTGLTIPEPSFNNGAVQIDSRGFRSPELESPKPAATKRLAFLGGSTTFCAEVSSNDNTWPAQFFAGLSQAWSGHLDFLNAGVPGYTVKASQQSFESRVAPTEPDVVFVYHAYNDLVRDCREFAIASGRKRAEPQVDWFGQYSLLWHLLRQNFFVKRKVREEQERDPLNPDLPAMSLAFQGRVEELSKQIQAAGAIPVLVTFCYRGRAEMSPTELEVASASAVRYIPYLTAKQILAGIQSYNAAIREAARRTGAVLLEGDRSIAPSAENFIDSVHLLDPGCANISAEILRQVLVDDGPSEPLIQAILK